MTNGKKNSNRNSKKSRNAAFGPAEYPFSAIVGQDEMKLALILNLIDPKISGVLIMGHRGTGKSTAVRSLASLLPMQSRVVGCVSGCDPNAPLSYCDDCRTRSKDGVKLKSVA